jgi:hypothetical protein
METHTHVQQGGFIDSPTGPSDPASPLDASLDSSTARSENNILEWMSYLPEDCIRRMIEMKWDLTT